MLIGVLDGCMRSSAFKLLFSYFIFTLLFKVFVFIMSLYFKCLTNKA